MWMVKQICGVILGVWAGFKTFKVLQKSLSYKTDKIYGQNLSLQTLVVEKEEVERDMNVAGVCYSCRSRGKIGVAGGEEM